MEVRITSIKSGNEFFVIAQSDAPTVRSIETALHRLPVPVAFRSLSHAQNDTPVMEPKIGAIYACLTPLRGSQQWTRGYSVSPFSHIQPCGLDSGFRHLRLPVGRRFHGFHVHARPSHD